MSGEGTRVGTQRLWPQSPSSPPLHLLLHLQEKREAHLSQEERLYTISHCAYHLFTLSFRTTGALASGEYAVTLASKQNKPKSGCRAAVVHKV